MHGGRISCGLGPCLLQVDACYLIIREMADIASQLLVRALTQAIEGSVRSYERSLVDEDEAVISGGAGVETKKELQELENQINCASFILAAGVSNPPPHIEGWISAARKVAFCLEDQIAMYAIRGTSDFQLYHMKYDIGMLRIGELTRRVRGHKFVGGEEGDMPTVMQRILEGMPQLSVISPFIRSIPSVPSAARIKMDDNVKKIEAFFTGPHPVLFLTGGQGSGKTTLMKYVYELQKERMESVHGTVGASSYGRMSGFLSILSELSLQFLFKRNKDDFNLCCWVDIAETGGLISLLKTVLKQSNVDYDSIHEFEIINMVRDTFKDKHCLIVLDNVQDTSVLYSLMTILQNMKWKIICLTRKDIQEVKNQDVLRLPGLEQYDSLKLLLSAAFCNFNSTNLQRENFNNNIRDDVLREAITWKYRTWPSLHQSDHLVKMVNLLNSILSKCQGNPSNIWSIGTLLEAYPPWKWEEIGERVDGMLIDGTKVYENRDPPIQLKDAILANAAIRHCFMYCLAFPESESETLENSGGIPARKLIRLWAAEGYVQDSLRLNQEQEAECVLEELIKKNLLVVKKKGFDGEVLKCSVNEHLRPVAEKMCEQQKFCKVVVDDFDEASPPNRMTKCFPISPNVFFRQKKPLSDRYRMLAVHGDRGVKELSKTLGKDIRLRSLLHFKTGRIEHPKLELTFRETYMLLRTLELQGANVAKLPPNIGCLVCLRYLGLRNTQLEDLPPTLQKLKHLMCLDIRDNNIPELADVSQFEEMRHLYLTNSFRSHSVAVREGLHLLVNLQTLSGAAYGDSSGNMPFEDQISRLRRLRKLTMKKVPSTSSKIICDAVKEIEALQSLAISCDRDGQKFDLGDLKIGKNLRKLKLGGPLGNFCVGEENLQMQSITFLYLWDSRLPVELDILDTLRDLTNLLVLSLLNTSTREQMSCEDGFKQLRKLSIISMENLSNFEFGRGAMQNLEELVFAKCGNLQTLPQGLDQLASLREVHLTEMLPAFCNEAKDKLKDKVYFQPDALSHVVSSRATSRRRN